MKTIILILCLFTILLGQSLPIPYLTPGDTIRYVMLMELCNPEFLSPQKISTQTAIQVLKNYKLPITSQGKYVLDLLVPCNLGGSATSKNVWPQPQKDVHKKNQIENRLNWMVCNAKISLKEARYLIKSDWVKAYKCLVLQDTTLRLYNGKIN